MLSANVEGQKEYLGWAETWETTCLDPQITLKKETTCPPQVILAIALFRGRSGPRTFASAASGIPGCYTLRFNQRRRSRPPADRSCIRVPAYMKSKDTHWQCASGGILCRFDLKGWSEANDSPLPFGNRWLCSLKKAEHVLTQRLA